MAHNKHLRLLDSNSDYQEHIHTMANVNLPSHYNQKVVGTLHHFAEAFTTAAAELGMHIALDPLGFEVMAVHGESNEALDIMLEALGVSLDALYESDSEVDDILHLVMAIENYTLALKKIRYNEAGRRNIKH